MLRQAVPLFFALSLVACDEPAQVSPNVGGGGGGESELEDVVFVQVTSRSSYVTDIDVLVHDAKGVLLRRAISASPGVVIEATPSDSVSIVWRQPDHPAPDDGWIVDSVRVTEETQGISFVIETDPPVLEPENAPVDIQVQAEVAEGVSQLFVGVTCGPTLPTSGAATFLNYVGCPDGSTSEVFAAGLDANGELATFSSALVDHSKPTQTVELPATVVPLDKGRIEIDWKHPGISVVQGSTALAGDGLVYFDPFTSEFTSPAEATPPVVYEPRIAGPPFAARVRLRADVAGISGCGGFVTADTFLGAEAQYLRLDRLAFPEVAFEPYRWSLAAEGARGDAVVARLDFHHGSYRWVEPATDGEHAIVFPELPDDLAGHFDPTEETLTGIDIMHDDREGTVDYAEYVSAAPGTNRGPSKENGSASHVGPCVGRY